MVVVEWIKLGAGRLCSGGTQMVLICQPPRPLSRREGCPGGARTGGVSSGTLLVKHLKKKTEIYEEFGFEKCPSSGGSGWGGEHRQWCTTSFHGKH